MKWLYRWGLSVGLLWGAGPPLPLVFAQSQGMGIFQKGIWWRDLCQSQGWEQGKLDLDGKPLDPKRMLIILNRYRHWPHWDSVRYNFDRYLGKHPELNGRGALLFFHHYSPETRQGFHSYIDLLKQFRPERLEAFVRQTWDQPPSLEAAYQEQCLGRYLFSEADFQRRLKTLFFSSLSFKKKEGLALPLLARLSKEKRETFENYLKCLDPKVISLQNPWKKLVQKKPDTFLLYLRLRVFQMYEQKGYLQAYTRLCREQKEGAKETLKEYGKYWSPKTRQVMERILKKPENGGVTWRNHIRDVLLSHPFLKTMAQGFASEKRFYPGSFARDFTHALEKLIRFLQVLGAGSLGHKILDSKPWHRICEHQRYPQEILRLLLQQGANIYVAEKNPKKALRVFQKILRHKPNPVIETGAHLWMAFIYQSLKSWVLAEGSLRKTQTYPLTFYSLWARKHGVQTFKRISQGTRSLLQRPLKFASLKTTEELTKHLKIQELVQVGKAFVLYCTQDRDLMSAVTFWQTALQKADSLGQGRGRQEKKKILWSVFSQVKDTRPDLFMKVLDRCGFYEEKKVILEYFPTLPGLFVPLLQGLDTSLVHGVICAESSFNPRAVSGKGAQGFMQLLPLHFTKELAPSPLGNIRAGCELLKALLGGFSEIPLALCAYNAGRSRVRTWVSQRPFPRGVKEQLHWIENAPFRETMYYVQKVLARQMIYEALLRPGGHKPAVLPYHLFKAEKKNGQEAQEMLKNLRQSEPFKSNHRKSG